MLLFNKLASLQNHFNFMNVIFLNKIFYINKDTIIYYLLNFEKRTDKFSVKIRNGLYFEEFI